jgi:hypothetical protein
MHRRIRPRPSPRTIPSPMIAYVAAAATIDNASFPAFLSELSDDKE